MPPAPARPLAIAHRGARSLAPENTLAAARRALALGADGWELDVALTADGVPIVLHDPTLERTSDAPARFPDRAPWPVAEFTLADLRTLDFGSWFVARDPFGQIAAGAVSQAEQQAFRGEPAPTLAEALLFTRDHGWFVNVEIKDASATPAHETIVARVVALLDEMDMAEQVLVSSFNHRYLEQVRRLNPAIRTGALVSIGVGDPAALLRELGAVAYHPHHAAIPLAAIRPLRDQGFEVNVWTVNDEATMQALIQAGASAIISDFPQDLRPLLSD